MNARRSSRKSSEELGTEMRGEPVASVESLEPVENADAQTEGLSRRAFVGAAMAAGAAAAALPPLIATKSAHAEIDPALAGSLPTGGHGAGSLRGSARQREALRIRVRAAELATSVPIPEQRTNGDEEALPSRIGNFSKGLPHNEFGEVDESAYAQFLRAVRSGLSREFEAIPLGTRERTLQRKLVNPQAGVAFDLQGTDPQGFAIRAAPAFSSAEEAGEIVENYWMALLRDVPFSEYATHPLALAAAQELSSLSDFRGPRQNGVVTPQTLFREDVPGCLDGPYVSQFLLTPIPFGAQFVEPRIRTAVPELDFVTDAATWLAVQNGTFQSVGEVFESDLRFIRNGRDIASYVHIDVLFQAYLNAGLRLLQLPNFTDAARSGLAGLVGANPGNPYGSLFFQDPFVTFGDAGAVTLIAEVATRALKAVWYQKWFVHRRLRPEAFAGAVHHAIESRRDYPIHPDVLNSRALSETFSRFGSYFLPQAFPEGSPMHPSYGAGHATVAGACVTILKALFDERATLSVVEGAPDGLRTRPVRRSLTVGGELNKLAVNIALGRNIAGVHWRTDGIESMRLGEEVAIGLLRDQRLVVNEAFEGYTFTRFDGTTCTI